MMNEFLSDPEIIGEFVTESREHLESLESKLLQLEENPEDDELLNAIFRTFHTIKGSSSFLGLVQITELSHKLENVLDKLRKGELRVSSEIIDLLFKGMDLLKSLIEDVASGEEEKLNKIIEYPSGKVSEFISNLQRIQEKKNQVKEEIESFKVKEKKDEEKEIFLKAVYQHLSTIEQCLQGLERDPSGSDFIENLFRAVHSLKSSLDYMKLTQVKLLVQKLEDVLQQIREKRISCSSRFLEGLKSGYQTLVQFIQSYEKDEIRDFDFQDVIEKIEKVFEKSEEKDLPDASIKKTIPRKEIVEKTIRVPEAKLDELMNLVGELVINRSTFYSIMRRIEEGEEVYKLSQEIKEAAQTMRRITTELQMTVTELHMHPIKTLFGRFPRLVRDLSREKGKKINLKISGEETRLDKMMIEKMTDPLIHLVRNAIDHGIETPEEREAKGKDPCGTVKLSALQEGESVIIQIEDDGRGMDPEFLREMAVKKGILTEERARLLSKKECLELIFLPGFSTATRITDLSGRGVGMDVVKDTVKKLNGEIEINTQLGKGTKFVIKLPLTLAITNVLLVETEKQFFAIPLSSIKETIKISRDDINYVFNEKVTVLRGKLLGVVDLRDLLNINTRTNSRKWFSIVVIQAEGKEVGLIVDKLHSQEEIVIKPLEGIVANTPGISGATILGDGKVIPILDAVKLIQMVAHRNFKAYQKSKKSY